MPPHCDSMDGPVVKAAMQALEAKNVDFVLPYVPKANEDEVREAYTKVMEVRRDSSSVRELVDRYFFETVVRIHRAGEGAAYTGLKPAGLDVGPVIPVAERAIETGSPKELSDLLCTMIRSEIDRRFAHLLDLRRHVEHGVDAARAYVEAMLGLQVYAHTLYRSIHAEPHESHHEHGA